MTPRHLLVGCGLIGALAFGIFLASLVHISVGSPSVNTRNDNPTVNPCGVSMSIACDHPAPTATPQVTISNTTPIVPSTSAPSQQIDVPAGTSANIITGDCVDTYDWNNIHAPFKQIHDTGTEKRALITGDGTVDGRATIYRHSGCYA